MLKASPGRGGIRVVTPGTATRFGQRAFGIRAHWRSTDVRRRTRNQSMSYTISISDSRKFLRVHVEGDVSAAAAREWSAELREASRAQGIQRLLVDVRSSRNVSTVLQNYQYAYRSSSDLELPKNVRSAILTSPDDRSHDMVETFMRNAGYNVRIFTDESAAIAWLEDDAR